MKKNLLIAFLSIQVLVRAQTLTYSNFLSGIGDTISISIAYNPSFSSSLFSIVGSGVTWNATGLTVQQGTPTIHMINGTPNQTPNASLYPNANFVSYDPNLTSLISYTYFNLSQDSLVDVGDYDPSTAHSVYLNPYKHLTFPFTLGDIIDDYYEKNNYSDASTFSSLQSGNVHVQYLGHGTLSLPNATYNNVALISESRTNSLGSDEYYYTWYNINNGHKLLYHEVKVTGVMTYWNVSPNATGISETTDSKINIYPNPANTELYLEYNAQATNCKIVDVLGNEYAATMHNISSTKKVYDVSGLAKGFYFLKSGNNTTTFIKK